jgi:hypothetical protein
LTFRLGIMLGSKLYYSISEKNYDETFSRLMVAINEKKEVLPATTPSPLSMQKKF